MTPSFRHETAALLRSPATWLYWAIMAGLLGIAVTVGTSWRDGLEHERLVSRAVSERALHDASEPPTQPWAVQWVSWARVPVTADFPVAPLAPLAIDRIDGHALALPLGVGLPSASDGEARHVSAQLMSAGRFDVATVLVLLFPLGLIAMCHDLWVGERSRGTLVQIIVAAASSTRWLVAVCAARWVVLVGPILLTVAGVVAAWGGRADMAAAAALAGVAAYGLLWILICASVGVLAVSSRTAAAAALTAWIAIVAVGPAAGGILAHALLRVPSTAQLEIELEREGLDAERDGQAMLTSYLDEHPELADELVSDDPTAWAKPYALMLEAESARRSSILAARQQRISDRRATALRIASMSPAVTMHTVLVTLAGNDDARLAGFRAAVDELRRERRAALVDRVLWSRPFDASDPVFSASTVDLGHASVHASLPWLAGLSGQCAAAGLVLLWVLRRSQSTLV